MCFIVGVVGILLAAALVYAVQNHSITVRQDVLVPLLILLVCLPIVIVTVGLSMYGGGKNKQVESQVINATLDVPVAAPVVTEAPVATNEADGSAKSKAAVTDKIRFSTLSTIDSHKNQYTDHKFDDKITLKRFCEEFRNYAAGELRLYYNIDDIRRFVAGLGVTHIAILQGMSGTGKTSLAYAFGKFVGNPSTIIPVQPMWKERTDLIGYYNEFTKQFNETLMLKKLYEANYAGDMYITVLDEMNIARVEYYFAEFLSLLELPNVEERNLDVVSDVWSTDPVLLNRGRIRLPANMWFVGTANNDDSTFAISDKVYDRAMVMNLDDKSAPFAPRKWREVHLSADRFFALVSQAQRDYRLTERNKARLVELDKYLINNFHITFGNRINKQISVYIPTFVACGGDELDALDDILAKKILRKLEMQNPVMVKNSAPGLLSKLDDLFGRDRMKQCVTVIHRLERNA